MGPDIIIGLYGIIGLIVLVILGIHVGIALGVVSLIGFAFLLGFDNALNIVVSSIYNGVAKYSLITLPLFIFMGYLAGAGDLSAQIYRNIKILAGSAKGAMAYSTVAACVGFGAISGSSLVSAAVFASISAPEMRAGGYDKRFSYGLVSASGIIGMLIPPSILAVIYGVLSGLSVGKLLIGGIGPGLLVSVLFSIYIFVLSRFKPKLFGEEITKKYSFTEKLKTIPKFWPVLIMVVIIFGGIFSGIFSPTEAAAVATFIIAIAILANGKNGVKIFARSIRSTASTCAMIFLVMAGALVFSRFLTMSGLSHLIIEKVVMAQAHPTLFLFIMSFVFILLGTIIDSTSMLILAVPIVNPMISKLGLDPYVVGIVFIFASQIGIITPPFGLAVYAVKGVAEVDVSLGDIFRGSFPFLLLLILGLIITILFPPIITTFIPL